MSNPSSLTDRALLARLLTFAAPKDAEEIANRLWERYKSLPAVLNADPRDLAGMGIGDHARTLLSMLLPAYGRCLRSDFGPNTHFGSIDTIGRYFTACFCGMTVETVYLMLLREDMTVIDCRRVAVGSVNSANLNVRALVEAALFAGARNVVVAHNHPGGVTRPSESDRNTTLALKNAFEAIGVNFHDHIIVAGNRFTPLLLSEENVLREETAVSDPLRS